jgi:hypothetical protein
MKFDIFIRTHNFRINISVGHIFNDSSFWNIGCPYDHYMLNAEVYTVKALVRADKTTLSHPTQVVLRMVKPVENTNRNITGNNWYTSMELVDQLKKKA